MEKMEVVKVVRTGNTKTISIPIAISQAMGVEVGDYMRLQYDTETETIIVTKVSE